MKGHVVISVALVLLISFGGMTAEGRGRYYAKYSPISEFIEPTSTLGIWFRDYVETIYGASGFGDFLSRLAESRSLRHLAKKAGVSYDDLYTSIQFLMRIDISKLRHMDGLEAKRVREAMLKLDIALSAIDILLSPPAREEFRREVLRRARPLSQVAASFGGLLGPWDLFNPLS